MDRLVTESWARSAMFVKWGLMSLSTISAERNLGAESKRGLDMSAQSEHRITMIMTKERLLIPRQSVPFHKSQIQIQPQYPVTHILV